VWACFILLVADHPPLHKVTLRVCPRGAVRVTRALGLNLTALHKGFFLCLGAKPPRASYDKTKRASSHSLNLEVHR